MFLNQYFDSMRLSFLLGTQVRIQIDLVMRLKMFNDNGRICQTQASISDERKFAERCLALIILIADPILQTGHF